VTRISSFDDTMPCPLLLIGAGHSHLVALRNWIYNGYRVPVGSVLVSPDASAWYSGMMPGLIAERFTPAECAVELEPLCRAAGLRLVTDEAVGLRASERYLTLGSGQALHYDLLSLNVGSVPPGPRITDHSVKVVPAKPFAGFIEQWQHWQQHAPPRELTILGAGPAAFELALAFRNSLPDSAITLITGSTLLHGQPQGLIKRARGLLQQRDISLIEGMRVSAIKEKVLLCGEEPVQAADALVLATGASAPAWLAQSGLSCDQQGFVTIGNTLQSENFPNVLASGDCSSLAGAQRSGVYAVRQGSILAANIPALIQGAALQPYRPQSNALALLSTADGRALMSYGPLSAGGKLIGKWKDHLDVGFMQRHRLTS